MVLAGWLRTSLGIMQAEEVDGRTLHEHAVNLCTHVTTFMSTRNGPTRLTITNCVSYK